VQVIAIPPHITKCLRHRPIARGGIQIRVDRTRLNVVDRDTADTTF
jgi:hypothetical protein